MSNYDKILQQFTKLKYNENSRLSEGEIKKALDDICKKNASLN
jgi:hypothetical protein